MTSLDLDLARERAEELLRAAEAGDPAALGRMRPGRSPRLTDARHAVAKDLGFPSWPALVARAEAVVDPSSPLGAARARWGERGEIELETGHEYAPGQPVRVHVRKRGHRYQLDDLEQAVAGAGAPTGWLPVAERVVAKVGLNVNHTGRVFALAVEGRDLDALVLKVAETSLAVHTALLELDV